MGGFYCLLALMNLYGVLIDPAFFAGGLGFTDKAQIMAFVDGWSPFAFEALGIGTFLLWASRRPLKYLSVVWFVIWLELLHGVLNDIYLMARGYNAAGYTAFIAIHLIIIVTGIWAARQAGGRTSDHGRGGARVNGSARLA